MTRMRLANPITPVLAGAAERLAAAGTAFRSGSDAMARIDLSGADWRDRFQDLLRSTGPAWGPGDRAIRDAHAAVSVLGDDPLGVAALAHAETARTTMLQAYSYIGQVVTGLPPNFGQDAARLAARRIVNAGRVVGDAARRAADGISALLARA